MGKAKFNNKNVISPSKKNEQSLKVIQLKVETLRLERDKLARQINWPVSNFLTFIAYVPIIVQFLLFDKEVIPGSWIHEAITFMRDNLIFSSQDRHLMALKKQFPSFPVEKIFDGSFDFDKATLLEQRFVRTVALEIMATIDFYEASTNVFYRLIQFATTMYVSSYVKRYTIEILLRKFFPNSILGFFVSKVEIPSQSQLAALENPDVLIKKLLGVINELNYAEGLLKKTTAGIFFLMFVLILISGNLSSTIEGGLRTPFITSIFAYFIRNTFSFLVQHYDPDHERKILEKKLVSINKAMPFDELKFYARYNESLVSSYFVLDLRSLRDKYNLSKTVFKQTVNLVMSIFINHGVDILVSGGYEIYISVVVEVDKKTAAKIHDDLKNGFQGLTILEKNKEKTSLFFEKIKSRFNILFSVTFIPVFYGGQIKDFNIFLETKDEKLETSAALSCLRDMNSEQNQPFYESPSTLMIYGCKPISEERYSEFLSKITMFLQGSPKEPQKSATLYQEKLSSVSFWSPPLSMQSQSASKQRSESSELEVKHSMKKMVRQEKKYNGLQVKNFQMIVLMLSINRIIQKVLTMHFLVEVKKIFRIKKMFTLNLRMQCLVVVMQLCLRRNGSKHWMALGFLLG